MKNPGLFESWVERFSPQKVILGADVKNGHISISGWKEEAGEQLMPFLKKHTDKGIENVLCTDISKDGMMEGPAIELYKDIMTEFPEIHLIASGGVSCIEDIEELNAAGIPAVVFGKAFYEGKITMEELARFL